MTDVIHKDFLGQEIRIGDRVISSVGTSSSGLKWGKVVSMAPKTVRVDFGYTWMKPGNKDPDNLIVMSEDQQQALAFQRLSGEKS